MQRHRPTLTHHRRQRIVLWALALLSWMAAMVFSGRFAARRHLRQRDGLVSLSWMTELVGKLLFVRAMQLARLRHRKRPVLWRHGRDRRRAHFMRSLLGARLRQKLTHKEARLWIGNLIGVLRNLDVNPAALARRLRRGLTRLWRTWHSPTRTAPLLRAGLISPVIADSS